MVAIEALGTCCANIVHRTVAHLMHVQRYFIHISEGQLFELTARREIITVDGHRTGAFSTSVLCRINRIAIEAFCTAFATVVME